MKNVLIYFRKDALLEQGNMPSQSRETCLPKAGKDTSPGRGGVSKSDPIVAGATRAAGLLTHLLLHHEEPSRGSGPIYRYQENRGEERG